MGNLSLRINPDRNKRPPERVRITSPDGAEIIIKVTKKDGHTTVHIEADRDDYPIMREKLFFGRWIHPSDIDE